MKRAILILIAAMGALLTGCLVPSLHPLYLENDIITRPEIVGTWTGQDDGTTWIFEKEPDSSYSLAYVDSEEADTSWFIIHLVQFDSVLFMDAYPNPSEILTDAYKSHLIAAHSFSKVQIDSEGLTISVIDADWLHKEIDSGRVHIAHEQLGPDDLVLTAAT